MADRARAVRAGASQADVYGRPVAGAEFRPLGPGHERLHLLVAADYAAIRGAPGRMGGGVEVGLRDTTTQLLAVARLGLASNAGGAFATRPVTLGAGLKLRQVSLDYAFEGSAVLGSQHASA